MKLINGWNKYGIADLNNPDSKYTGLLCDASDSSLLVIDIQTRLTDSMPVKVIERLKNNSAILLSAAKILSIPVFATTQYSKGLGPIESTIENQLPENTLRFEKTCFSCADSEDVLQGLKQCDRKQVILLGIEAHICVLQTAIGLLSHGYQVFVALDAVCSRQRDNYENAIQRMADSNVIICNTESILFEWLRDASHTHFKAVSALIR